MTSYPPVRALATASGPEAASPATSMPGSAVNGTYTPEMNWRTVNGSVITGVALAADRGTLLAATPSSEQAAVPSTNTQAKVHQRPGDVGRCRW